MKWVEQDKFMFLKLDYLMESWRLCITAIYNQSIFLNQKQKN
jgi:hypothetical protein